MKLNGKKAIITGANRGLGEAIARAFFREGASVLLCARDETPLRRVADSLAQEGDADRVCFLSADVSKIEEIDRIIEQVEKKWNGVDILVNNAGIYGPLGHLHEIDW